MSADDPKVRAEAERAARAEAERAARVEAIMRTLLPGDYLRENVLAAEVLRLRVQVARWETVRTRVTFAHKIAEVTHERHDEEYEGGKRSAFWQVLKWIEAAENVGEGDA